MVVRVPPKEPAAFMNWNIEVANSSAAESFSGSATASSFPVASSLGCTADSVGGNGVVDWALRRFSAVGKPEVLIIDPSLRERMRVDSTLGRSVRPRRIASMDESYAAGQQKSRKLCCCRLREADIPCPDQPWWDEGEL